MTTRSRERIPRLTASTPTFQMPQDVCPNRLIAVDISAKNMYPISNPNARKRPPSNTLSTRNPLKPQGTSEGLRRERWICRRVWSGENRFRRILTATRFLLTQPILSNSVNSTPPDMPVTRKNPPSPPGAAIGDNRISPSHSKHENRV